MGAEDNRLSLEQLAHRLEALERENAELRQEVSALRGSGTRPSEVTAPIDSGIYPAKETVPERSDSEVRVSRRWLLSKAGAAATG